MGLKRGLYTFLGADPEDPWLESQKRLECPFFVDHLDLFLGQGTGWHEKKAHFGATTRLMWTIANI